MQENKKISVFSEGFLNEELWYKTEEEVGTVTDFHIVESGGNIELRYKSDGVDRVIHARGVKDGYMSHIIHAAIYASRAWNMQKDLSKIEYEEGTEAGGWRILYTEEEIRLYHEYKARGEVDKWYTDVFPNVKKEFYINHNQTKIQ